MDILTHRYIARIVVEAQTPLLVASGNTTLLTDITVQKDHYGLPMIPGTSLLGVLRHTLEDNCTDNTDWSKVFGKTEGDGALLKISSAYLLQGDNKIAEGLEVDIDKTLLSKLDVLPKRQHVRMTHRGVAQDQGLFDNEIVYKGARFLFEIELSGTESFSVIFDKLLGAFCSESFRVGQGTRNGYGRLCPIDIRSCIFDLTTDHGLEAYQNYDVSLNANNKEMASYPLSIQTDLAYSYKLTLTPDDFFIFGSQSDNDDVDLKPYEEEIMQYSDSKIKFVKNIVLPASSIKGAIAHRVAFHYNRLKGNTIESVEKNMEKYIGKNNTAVKALFGTDCAENQGKRGLVMIDDIFLENQSTHILNHVAIDRFTGGAMAGALFSEEVSAYSEPIELHIVLLKDEEIDVDIEKAFELTLLDICKGRLPLGGMTNKGHGFFSGILEKAGEVIYNSK